MAILARGSRRCAAIFRANGARAACVAGLAATAPGSTKRLDRAGTSHAMRPAPILPPPLAAPKEAPAAQLAAELARVSALRPALSCSWRRRASAAIWSGRPRATCRLREPGALRAARDDAHSCARRQPDGRVCARAAHLRADQHHAEARHRAPTCRPRTSASTSMAAWTSPASAAPCYKWPRTSSRAATGAPKAPPPSRSRSPRTSC